MVNTPHKDERSIERRNQRRKVLCLVMVKLTIGNHLAASRLEASRSAGKIAPIPLQILGAAAGASLESARRVLQNLHAARSLVALEWIRRTPLSTRKPNIPRVGWEASPINHAIIHLENKEFRKLFRLSKPVFGVVLERLVASGHLRDNECRDKKHRVTAQFKLTVGHNILYCILHIGSTHYNIAKAARIHIAAR